MSVRLARLSGHRVLAAVLAAVFTLVVCWLIYTLDIPNPIVVLIVVMILFLVTCDIAVGAASWAVVIGYALFYFSDAHDFISYSGDASYHCAVIVVSLTAIYVMVAVICKRVEHAYKHLKAANDQLERQNELLKEQSDHDALTGLLNRRGGNRRIAELFDLDEYNAPRHPYGMLATMDIDDFKQINDSFGHAAGDQALKLLAERMGESFPHDSALIRMGGDEFQIVLASDGGYEDMEGRLQRFAEQTFEMAHDGNPLWFCISCGYALFPLQGTGLIDLGHRADRALYTAKTNGKHQALRYDAGRDEDAQQQSGFLMRNLSESLPVSFMVYRADESEQILMVSNTLLKLCECDTFGEFMAYSGGSFRTFVHPDDVDRVERSICGQVGSNHYGLDSVNYRIITKSGRVIHIHDLGRLVKDPVLGDLFYVALFDRDSVSALEESVRA